MVTVLKPGQRGQGVGELSATPTPAHGLDHPTGQSGVAEEAGDILDTQRGLGLYSATGNVAKTPGSLNLSRSWVVSGLCNSSRIGGISTER